MKPVYKKIKVAMPHCPVCEQELSGDNSILSPWECKCGVWKNSFSDPLNYEIVASNKAEGEE